MSWHLISMGAFLTFLMTGCPFKKNSTPAPEELASQDSTPDVIVPISKPIPTVEEVKPVPPVEEPTPKPVEPAPAETPCGISLVIATDQLGTSPLKAQVEFNGISQELTFTPSAKFSTLCLRGLKETPGGILSLKILQNDTLRFVAKRANTAYTLNQMARVVIDNCLIHAAPWDGRTNDGSCDWNIKE